MASGIINHNEPTQCSYSNTSYQPELCSDVDEIVLVDTFLGDTSHRIVSVRKIQQARTGYSVKVTEDTVLKTTLHCRKLRQDRYASGYEFRINRLGLNIMSIIRLNSIY